MTRQHRDRRSAVLALVLVAAYVLQAYLQIDVAGLAELQADDRYKVASGAFLAMYLVFQARLGARRLRDPAGSVSRHKLIGALAPAVLYLHATRFGYGYLLLLAWLYLGTIVVGLVHRPVLAARARSLYTWWFVIHIAMSTLLLVLGAYHAVVALAYE